MEFPLESKGKTLQEPCVAVTREGWDNSNEKINGKLSKSVWQFTQHNCENVSTMAQKKVLKMSGSLEAIDKCYMDLV